MITLFFRKANPNKKSIENVFSIIINQINSYVIKSVYVPNKKADLSSLIKNVLYARKNRNQINHITGDIHYIALGLPTKKTILTIHDISSAFQGNFIRNFIIKLSWFWLPAKRVNIITVISEFSRIELLQLVPFAKEKIKVIYNPVDPNIQCIPKVFNTEKPVILHIGTKPNKNLERTIEAIKDIDCHLIVIGKLQPRQIKKLRDFNFIESTEKTMHKNSYSNYYNISYAEIINLYQLCDLLCFASTYEGFGMPIIEAQATGRPVVAGNAGAIPEVAGDSACLVNPYNIIDIREGILKVINDIGYREDLIEKGLENIKRFNAKKIADQYIKIYKDIIAN